MGTCSAFELLFLVLFESNFCIHIEAVDGCSSFDKWEIEKVSVIGGHNGWLGILDVLKPSLDHSRLIEHE